MKLEFFAETAGGAKRMDNLIVPFVEGARKLGLSADIRPDGLPSDDCDIAVVFGNKGQWASPRKLRDNIISRQVRHGGIWIGIDIGAFLSWQMAQAETAISYRIALGPPNGQGQYFNTNSPADRWILFRDILKIDVKEWRETGDAVLICGQADRGWQYDNPTPYKKWLRTAVQDMRRHTDRPLVFRPHPADKSRDDRWLLRHGVEINRDRVGRNLHQVLDHEWAIVTYSSSAAEDSVICGIPAFCRSDNCVARVVCNTDYANLEAPILYDRAQWLHDYAYTSWLVDEIREGIPLKRLLVSRV
jgi:hypothetical protein